jgi:hypothetical protein
MHIGTSHDTLSNVMEQRTIHFHRCIGSVHHFLVPVKTRVSYVITFTSFNDVELAEQEKLFNHNLKLSQHLLCWNCLRWSPYSRHVSVSSNFSFVSVPWWTGKVSCLYRVYVWVADGGVNEMRDLFSGVMLGSSLLNGRYLLYIVNTLTAVDEFIRSNNSYLRLPETNLFDLIFWIALILLKLVDLLL